MPTGVIVFIVALAVFMVAWFLARLTIGDPWKGKVTSAVAARPKPESIETQLRAELASTQERMTRLHVDHDAWKHLAEQCKTRIAALETDLLQARGGDTTGDGSRFGRLRRLIATEFHPDHAKHEGIEKLVRAEIFKTLWPKIEQIGRPL